MRKIFLIPLLVLAATGLFGMAHADLGAAPERVRYDLPEVVTALDSERQVQVQVVLQLAERRFEPLVREQMIPLRHALVLQLASASSALDGAAVAAFADDFRREANDLLEEPGAVRAVLVQKFVVQPK